MVKLTHINTNNNPTMVDVSHKEITHREARASGKIIMNKEAYEAIINDNIKKGPVIQTAVIASIIGVKKTSELIPMCHPLLLNKVDCNITRDDDNLSLIVEVLVKCEGKTGVEMEALNGVSIGLLTIYDMVKAIDKNMTITDIALCSKKGGKSGYYIRDS